MPWGSLAKPSVNPLTQLPPKAPSALIKTTRWTLFISGILYGAWRLRNLTPGELAEQEKYREYFEFAAAKKARMEAQKTANDEVDLYREAKGLPKLERPPIE